MAEEDEKKSSITAIVLSLLFAGLGFAYLDHYKRFAASLLSAFIILFLTAALLQSFGIFFDTLVGKFFLFIVVFSFFAYLAFLTKELYDLMHAGEPVSDTFEFWVLKKSKQEKINETKQETKKKGISFLGLAVSALAAVLVLFAYGPIAALIALAIMLVLTYLGSI